MGDEAHLAVLDQLIGDAIPDVFDVLISVYHLGVEVDGVQPELIMLLFLLFLVDQAGRARVFVDPVSVPFVFSVVFDKFFLGFSADVGRVIEHCVSWER